MRAPLSTSIRRDSSVDRSSDVGCLKWRLLVRTLSILFHQTSLPLAPLLTLSTHPTYQISLAVLFIAGISSSPAQLLPRLPQIACPWLSLVMTLSLTACPRRIKGRSWWRRGCGGMCVGEEGERITTIVVREILSRRCVTRACIGNRSFTGSG